MKSQKILLIALIISNFHFQFTFGQCLKFPGTIQISDTFSIEVVDITVSEYAGFIVANGYDTTLFPEANFLNTTPYKELFTDLYNKTYHRFLKKRAAGSDAFYINHPTGNKDEKRKMKKWLEMPIGGISHTQAEHYCRWLENYYNQILRKHKSHCFFEIRLATQAELNYALQIKHVLTIPGLIGQKTYRFVAITHTLN